MEFDAAKIDQVFRLIERPVWIVTAAHGTHRGGLLATWVAQCSLDPEKPILLAGLAPHHFTTSLVTASGRLAAHLLTTDQASVAMNFAIGSGRDRDKLAAIPLAPNPTDAPILADCLGWMSGQVISRHDTGDRSYFWILIDSGGQSGRGEPLTEKKLFAAATVEQREQLKRNLMEDIELLRPTRDAWLANP